jgi:anaerobic selenocysteine-containing dehydrogenase/Fe-S-cluster-containing dehydrogenase component
MERRTFLKIAGVGSVAFAVGCNATPEKTIHALVRSPEDMVTGQPTWYASTCRECPAGCGVLAKNREGRVIKLEGNPLHPVNQGKLCIRGQAALQRLYHPDRLKTPLHKENGRWKAITFSTARELVRRRLSQAAANGPDRVAMMTEVTGDALTSLFTSVLAHHESRDGLSVFEPFAHESLKFAHEQVFGRAMLPGYRMDRADMLVSFGADFLESWLSPVEYGRQFKAMHAWDGRRKGFFVQISPFQSLTAANADQWLMCRPGSEAAVAMGLIRQLLAAGRGGDLPATFRTALREATSAYTPQVVAQQAGLAEPVFQKLFERLQGARAPLVLPTATTARGNASAAADLASVLLNAILDPSFARYDFGLRQHVEKAHPRARVNAFWQHLSEPSVQVLLLNHVNPLYNLPSGLGVESALARPDLFVVAFTNMMDETAEAADLIIPVQHPLESWDLYESKHALTSILQPTLGKIGAAPGVGDLFLDLLPDNERPRDSYHLYIQQWLTDRGRIADHLDWLHLVQRGGRFESDGAGDASASPRMQLNAGAVKTLADLQASAPAAADLDADATRRIVHVSASLRFYDGRAADLPWLPEIPDPVTQVAWQTVAMMHPQVLAQSDWAEGDRVALTTDHGRVVVHVYAHPGLHPAVVVIPAGQGHSQLGRWTAHQGVNPVTLLGPAVDPSTGVPDYSAPLLGMAPADPANKMAAVSGNRFQHGRTIALSVPLADAATPPRPSPYMDMAHFPLTLPLPEGYDHRRDFFPAHAHDTYRWSMVVDLDRCIGCSACVAACYAENNLGIVGEQRIIEGREMSWIRIERYQDEQDATRLTFLPMLCQHCDNAPCESVCPVYAPHHNKEGLNTQIYNRCIGTRYCGQNCPYKVRRFNWFQYRWPEPLNMQLNPDVTVRGAGVMEKCSFCIQRIKAGRNIAKNEQREIRDGEVIPACVQTCPTDALVFGNLMDPDSRVRKMVEDPRAYQVLGYLNTKPAVIYLKKVLQEI